MTKVVESDVSHPDFFKQEDMVEVKKLIKLTLTDFDNSQDENHDKSCCSL